MLGRLLRGIRPDERRPAGVAFFTLFGFLGSHSILETARDALFLAKVPAARLPWMYLGIAVASLAAGRLQAALTRRTAPRPALAASVAVAGAVTATFWVVMGMLGDLGLYALYVWSGVLTTLVLVHFWALLGEIFSITQAKRLYGFIGAGSVLGAIVGSGTASALARVVPAGALLAVSAGGFFATAAVPLFFGKTSAAPVEPTAQKSGLLGDARHVIRQPYALRVAVLLIVSTTCVTVADYLFKSTVAATIPKAQLGAWLGSVYFVLNLLSLGAQLGLVRWLLRRFDLSTALVVLPVLLAMGGVGLVAGGGLVAALVVKGADGTLRYSLHRTATELLFVPLGDESRRRTKAFLDIAGQRGGQTIASLGILGATALALPGALGVVLLILAVVWIGSAVDLRRHYLDLFRKHLCQGRTVLATDFPELDVASLETLVAALDSQDDAEVLAALDVLEREKKGRLVPGLILYHPSEEVVVRALRLFVGSGRPNVVPIVDRLLEHESVRVRSAAIAARAVLAHDARLLNMRLSLEESPEVRATIVVHLIAGGEIVGAEADERLADLVRRGSAATRVALADAVALREAKSLTGVFADLARAPEAEVRVATARAIARLHMPELMPTLVELLGDERARPIARGALAAHGDAAFVELERVLADSDGRREVRCEVPRAMVLLDPQRAAVVLTAALPHEGNGMVRYRAIRALERLISEHPDIRLDPEPMSKAIDGTLARAYRYLERALVLERGAAATPARATPGHGLLVAILRDKQRTAVERLFRLLGLRMPAEDFGRIYRGVEGTDRGARASSIELLENLLEPPLRGAVVGLVDDIPDAERLAAAGNLHTKSTASYDALLERLLRSESYALQEAAAFHIGELRLAELRPALEKVADDRRANQIRADAPRSDVLGTLDLLAPPAEAVPC
jgi:ATP:ADP antiporter, AAA family